MPCQSGASVAGRSVRCSGFAPDRSCLVCSRLEARPAVATQSRRRSPRSIVLMTVEGAARKENHTEVTIGNGTLDEAPCHQDAIGTVRQSSAISRLSRSDSSSWVGIVSRRSTTSRAAGKLFLATKLAAWTSGMSLTALG